jgi:hypothetical protein
VSGSSLLGVRLSIAAVVVVFLMLPFGRSSDDLSPSTAVPAVPATAPSGRRAQAHVPQRRTEWPPALQPEQGWFIESSGPLPRGTRQVPFAAASTIAFVDGPRYYPTSTAKALPPDGAVIHASFPDPHDHPRHNVNFPRLSGMPRVSDFQVRLRWEGQVAPNVPEYVLWTEIHRQLLDLRIWFGTLHPAASTLALADRELKTLSVSSYRSSPRTPHGRCPRTPSVGTYQPIASTNAGAPGAAVNVWGGMPTRMEDGSYAGPGGRIEFWWNLDPEKYWTVVGKRTPSPAATGPVQVLGSRSNSKHCSYELQLHIPDVAAGTYVITAVSVGRGSSTSFPPIPFHVKAAPD